MSRGVTVTSGAMGMGLKNKNKNFRKDRAGLIFLIALGISMAFFLSSCRGNFSKERPIHPNPNMDIQPKFRAQSQKIEVPEGVLPFGVDTTSQNKAFQKSDARLFFGLDLAGNYIDSKSEEYLSFVAASINQTEFPDNITYTERIPLAVTKELIFRGEQQFNIYCAACHDRVGTAKSIIIERALGFPRPPDLSDMVVMSMSDGEIFNIISHGRRTMPSYSLQVAAEDRWSIVSYIRTLQVARNAALSDVPPAQRILLIRERKEYLEATAAEEKTAEEIAK